MTRRPHHALISAIARFGLSPLRRVTPALLIGLALAACLWLGVVPITRFSAQHPSLAPRLDPRIADVLALALNAVFLIALFSVDRLRRRSSHSGDQPWE